MIRVGLLGHGVVGSGVAEILRKNGDVLWARTGQRLELASICDLRDFSHLEYASLFTKDALAMARDKSIDVFVECMGGVEPARSFVLEAVRQGKHVVTSNKALVVAAGEEIAALAQEKGVRFLYEASVGGGIPILRPLTSCLAANELSQVTGILNGTTNYILTRMIKAGLTFEQALKEAQENGYAERDPSADVDGHDACRKICILAALAFGQHVYPDQVPTQGIRGVTLADVAYADSCGYKIKLLGRAIRERDGKLCAFVAPHLVPASNPLSGVEDVFNAISVTGNAIGDVMFYGRGAGKLPTASAVVADVIDIAKDLKTARCAVWGPGARDLVVSSDILSSRWYVRGTASMDKVRAAFGEISPLARGGAPAGETAFLTAPMTEPQVRARLEGMELHSLIRVLE